jgi:hypothetical protein
MKLGLRLRNDIAPCNSDSYVYHQKILYCKSVRIIIEEPHHVDINATNDAEPEPDRSRSMQAL